MASSNRSRNRLHVSKLEAYKQFCVSQGWVEEPGKSFFEILRMRHPEVKDLLIVHTRCTDKLVHFTIWGVSAQLFNEFQKINGNVK